MSSQPAAAHPLPWYLRPFFRDTGSIEPKHLRTLFIVSLGMFFENYDIGLLSAALPQISSELGIDTDSSGFYLGAIRLGGFGTILALIFADRIGRRRLFLIALLGMSAGTAATALSQTPLQLALFQMGTRVFMLTATAVALVILVEEFPAEHRGAAVGLLGILGGMGVALAAGLYAAVDYLPYGWRALYAVGLVPVIMVPFFRRTLTETRRFEDSRERSGDEPQESWLAPVRGLIRTHPRRALAVGLAGMFGAMSNIAFFQYISLFVQEYHGWVPWQYAAMFIAGGMIGMFGTFVGGRGSDRWGRRVVGFVTMILVPPCVALFYLGPSVGLVFGYGLTVFCILSADIVIRALSAELFPTAHRGTASGWLIAVQTLGWVVALFTIGLATRAGVSLPVAIVSVSLAAGASALCFLLLPETRSRELEEIG